MFKDYLKSRCKIFLLLMAVEGIFISTYFLFDMPSVTMLYPLFLSLVLVLAVGIIDFLIVLNKHRKIQRNDYPAPSGPLEKDYREIIGKLKEEFAVKNPKIIPTKRPNAPPNIDIGLS